MAKEYYDYRCTLSPAGCTQYQPDVIYSILVDEPPPQQFFWPSGPCEGAVFELVEDQ